MPRNTVAKTLFGKTLWDNRRVLTVWAIATSLLAMMYAGFYPQLSQNSTPNIPEALEGFNLSDVGSAAGYLQGSVFGLLVPLLVTFYGAATGARMISADEESGYLDLLLAHPLSRTRLVLQRFAALATGAVGIATVVLLAMLTIRTSAELDSVSIGEFTAQCLNLALLAITFGALATGIGAAFGKGRAVIFGTTAGIGVLTYALNGFAPQIHAGWLQKLTPFHYYIGGEPLKYGFQPGHAAALIAFSAVLVTTGIWRFNHRDLAT